jgi:hypothetical protein
MPLRESEAKILIAKAKERKPDLTRDEAKAILAEANQRVGARIGDPKDMNIGEGFFKDLHKVGDVTGYGTTARNLGLLTMIGQAGTTAERRGQTLKVQQEWQEIMNRADKETDPKKKKQLMAEADMLIKMDEVAQKAYETDLAWRKGAGDIRDRDIEKPGQFVMRRVAGQSAEIAQTALPQMLNLPSATVGQRILSAGVRGATAGGLQGVSRASIDADTGGEALGTILGSATVGGIAGAGIQTGVEGLTYAGNKFNNLRGKMKEKAVNLWKSTQKKNIKNEKFFKKYPGGKEGAFNDAIKFELSPTKDGLSVQFEEYQPEFQDIMDETIDRMNKKGLRMNVADAFKQVEKEVLEELSYDKTLQKSAQNWFDANKHYKHMTNVLPSNLRETYINLNHKVGGMVTQDVYGADRARKAFAQELTKRFKMFATDECRDAIQKYWLMTGLLDSYQKEPKFGIVEVAGAGASPGTGAMNLLELMAMKTLRSPGVKRRVSQFAYQNAPNVVGTINQKSANIKPVEYVVSPMVSALQRMINKENESKVSNKLLK